MKSSRRAGGELEGDGPELLSGLLNKIAHGPLTEIRRAAALPDGEETIALIRRVFRLEEYRGREMPMGHARTSPFLKKRWAAKKAEAKK